MYTLLDQSKCSPILSLAVVYIACCKLRSASRAPCVAWMCLAASPGCILPRLFQAISHLPSNLSHCIITIFAIIAVIIVFPQVNSKATEFFRQCEIFYHKYLFLALSNLMPASFPFSVKFLLLQLPAPPHCYSQVSRVPVREGSMHKHPSASISTQ